MPIESVMPSSHLILCRPLLLLPPIPPSIRVFSNESALRMSPLGLGWHIQDHMTLIPSWPTHCKLGAMDSISHETEGVQGSFPSSALNKWAPH